jgi:methylmalonyl-CoA carboxyltransferase small subunit
MRLKIVVEGRTYDVEVEVMNGDQPSYASESYVSMPAANPVPLPPPVPFEDNVVADLLNNAKVCRSPISGIIVRNAAAAGQEVKKGDVLMVLEAMKMETDITAPYTGKIQSLNCRVGDSVRGGQILVEFE